MQDCGLLVGVALISKVEKGVFVFCLVLKSYLSVPL